MRIRNQEKAKQHRETWKAKHPEMQKALVKKHRRVGQEGAFSTRQEWSLKDLERVLAHEMPDRELAALIGRSRSAIQTMRRYLKEGRKIIGELRGNHE